MSIRFRAVVTETFKDIDADLFRCWILWMPCEQLVHQRNQIMALPSGLNAPRLVVDAAEDKVDVPA